MDIEVRPARVNDCRFLAQVMYDSMLPGQGRGIFDEPLEGTGCDSVTFHEVLLRTGANNWGQLDSFIVLEAEGSRPVGAMGGFLSNLADMRPLTPQGFGVVSAELGWSKETGRDFWRKYVSFFGMFGNAPQLSQPAEFTLEYAAIDPELRGQGLYGRLLQAHVERGRELGYRSLGGTAIFGNDSVLRALNKFGFREHARFGPEYYGGRFPGLIRLVLEI